jgi:hypothetical protein
MLHPIARRPRPGRAIGTLLLLLLPLLARALAPAAALAQESRETPLPGGPGAEAAGASPGPALAQVAAGELVVAQRGESPPESEGGKAAGAAQVEPLPVYQPPRRGAPRPRVGGGSRGAGSLPSLLALAPDHVGETVAAEPSLFWHLDLLPGEGAGLVFALTEAQRIEPVAELALPRPARPGIQRIRLRDLGLHLELGVEYEWSVALVSDPERRDRDVIAAGLVRRVAPPEGLAPAAGANEYARRGLWYDALEAACDALEAAPGDPALRDRRDALLRQAGREAATRE